MNETLLGADKVATIQFFNLNSWHEDHLVCTAKYLIITKVILQIMQSGTGRTKVGIKCAVLTSHVIAPS